MDSKGGGSRKCVRLNNQACYGGCSCTYRQHWQCHSDFFCQNYLNPTSSVNTYSVSRISYAVLIVVKKQTFSFNYMSCTELMQSHMVLCFRPVVSTVTRHDSEIAKGIRIQRISRETEACGFLLEFFEPSLQAADHFQWSLP